MSTVTIEITKFKLNTGVTLSEYFVKFEPVFKQFLTHQPGFIGIKHLQNNDGYILNYVEWKSLHHAQSAASKAMSETVCVQWFSLMKEDSIVMEHYTVIG